MEVAVGGGTLGVARLGDGEAGEARRGGAGERVRRYIDITLNISE